MSTRYARILADEAYEAQIQATYSPPTVTNAATRPLSLRRQKERDGDAFRLPTLSQCCLNVAARNFLTHILPSQEMFQDAQIASSSGAGIKGKKRSSNATTAPKLKRPRVVARGIGNRPIYDEETAAGDDFVPSDSDDDGEDAHIGIAAASGRRSARTRQQPAAKARAGNLSVTELTGLAQDNDQLLRMVPDRCSAKLLRLLRSHCPTALTANVLAAYFIAGRSEIELDASMTLLSDSPEVINSLIRRATHSRPLPGPSRSLAHGPPLTRLSLSGMTRLSPEVLASLFRRCSHLEEVVIKGCVRVDSACIDALLETNADSLKVINANFTDIGIQGVEAVVSQARRLEVLKVANVLGLTDKAVPDMVRRAMLKSSESKPPFVALSKLKTLKIRGTQLGIVGINSLILACRASLENLDVCQTNLHSEGDATMLSMSLGYNQPFTTEGDLPPPGPSTALRAPLRKLNLSSTFASAMGIFRAVELISQLSETLETLVWQKAKLSSIDYCRLVYWRETTFPRLQRLSLSEGICVGFHVKAAALQEELDPGFSPGVENLDLSHTDLSAVQYWLREAETGHEPGEEELAETPPPRQFNTKVLDLSGTRASDENLAFFAERCPALQKINLSTTHVTSEGVGLLVSRCRFLTSIDLTGCRGVPVRDRRRIFEALDAIDESEDSDAG